MHVFLHKAVLTRGCSTSALSATFPTLLPSWQATTSPKTSVMITGTPTLQTRVPWEWQVDALVQSSLSINITLNKCCHLLFIGFLMYSFAPHHSSRWVFGKCSGHSRVQQRVSETSASFWPRARLPSTREMGENSTVECHLFLTFIYLPFSSQINWMGEKYSCPLP